MDPRIARTRQALQQALLMLAREHDLDAISVADITARAGVHRSSFYQHYADKGTLLADAIDAAVEEAIVRSQVENLARDAVIADEAQVLATLTVFLEHANANAALFRRVLGEHGSPLAVAKLRERIDGIVRQGVERNRVECGDGASSAFALPLDLEVAAVTGAAVAAVGAWLELRPQPRATQAAAWIWTLLSTPLIPVDAVASTLDVHSK